jgi:hypothetical protein
MQVVVYQECRVWTWILTRSTKWWTTQWFKQWWVTLKWSNKWYLQTQCFKEWCNKTHSCRLFCQILTPSDKWWHQKQSMQQCQWWEAVEVDLEEWELWVDNLGRYKCQGLHNHLGKAIKKEGSNNSSNSSNNLISSKTHTWWILWCSKEWGEWEDTEAWEAWVVWEEWVECNSSQ